ncbi:hypothetical protein ACFE04_010874 [Oxalis oulophora]
MNGGGDGISEGTIDVVHHIVGFEGDADLEPQNGIHFDSHEAAYTFYQEYAKSMGFTTSIKNSRRSKKSKEFIDAKFACSRYGVTPESDSGSSRRSSVKKTDCKASMHVKRRADGKWIIHEFIKEHNHELLPALAYHFRYHRNVKLAEKNNIDILHALSERTRKMYVEMSRKSVGHQNIGFLENGDNNFEKDMGSIPTRVNRYNDLCKQAIELSEEASMSDEGYNIAVRALVEALKHCVNVNNSNNSVIESSNFSHEAEEENQGTITIKSAKKKNAVKRRKVQPEPDVLLAEAPDNLQLMENISSEGMTLNGYYGAHQNVQGMVPLNLMEPPHHDGYYVNQQSMPGLGQLNTMGSNHDGFFGTQSSMQGLGLNDFRPPGGFSYSLQDDHHLRSTQLHGSTSRHP